MKTEAMRQGFGSVLTRRNLMGRLLLGSGAVLTALHLDALAREVTRKAKVLLHDLPDLPQGLEDAVNFPLIEAIHGRRARRFSLGAAIPDGPTAYSSRHKPMPLDELERMMVLTTVAGNTGWLNLHPFNPRYVPAIPNYAAAAGGRTFPSSAGFHTSEIFFTDDSGTYFFATRDLHPASGVSGAEGLKLKLYLDAHRKRIRKLSDKRIHIPADPAHIEMHNPWCVNVPGSTLFIPVADLAQHHIAVLCYLVQNGGLHLR